MRVVYAHAMVAETFAMETLGYSPFETWQDAEKLLLPGAHAAILVRGPHPGSAALDFRRLGFEFRDTLLVAVEQEMQICLIFRKPVAEKTVAAQAVRTGTGGMNIGACRVKHASKEDFDAHKAMVDTLKAKGGSLGNSWKNVSDLSNANEVSTAGRWPGNLVLVHASGCRRTGEVKMDAPVINRFDDGMKPFGNGAGHTFTSTQTGDEEGKETVTVYSCASGCMVARLNVQSGHLRNGGHLRQSATKPIDNDIYGSGFTRVQDTNFAGDSGGASRFFSQFESKAELREWVTTLVLPHGGVLLDPFQEPE